VKLYLMKRFNPGPDQLRAVGFGEAEFKNTANPLAAENRRVEIVNN
jgi:flagellar motor protein MotB